MSGHHRKLHKETRKSRTERVRELISGGRGSTAATSCMGRAMWAIDRVERSGASSRVREPLFSRRIVSGCDRLQENGVGSLNETVVVPESEGTKRQGQIVVEESRKRSLQKRG